jgi:hypothetical protein
MRIENWRSNLLVYLDGRERQSFAYGVNDCLLMTAGAVEAMTGIDHAKAYRGCYSTLTQGKKVIGGEPLDLVASIFPAIPPSQAADGDIGAKPVGQEWAFGVIVGPHFYVQAEAGLGILPRGDIQKAFRVE